MLRDLSPLQPAGFGADGGNVTAVTTELRVQAVRDEIVGLVSERQELREARAAPEALELNRLAIVRAQWELSFALVALYLRPTHQMA